VLLAQLFRLLPTPPTWSAAAIAAAPAEAAGRRPPYPSRHAAGRGRRDSHCFHGRGAAVRPPQPSLSQAAAIVAAAAAVRPLQHAATAGGRQHRRRRNP
jgi:hypothetical protein